jgi:hypothetical protein
MSSSRPLLCSAQCHETFRGTYILTLEHYIVLLLVTADRRGVQIWERRLCCRFVDGNNATALEQKSGYEPRAADGKHDWPLTADFSRAVSVVCVLCHRSTSVAARGGEEGGVNRKTLVPHMTFTFTKRCPPFHAEFNARSTWCSVCECAFYYYQCQLAGSPNLPPTFTFSTGRRHPPSLTAGYSWLESRLCGKHSTEESRLLAKQEKHGE